MNSDELGEKGESRFRELCADAGLICNKSDRDRTGWDFIVEFPFTDTETIGQSFDNRVTPISSHVQVKTLWDSTESFKMRLTSAERLAKELKPAFICVFKVDRHNLQVTKAFLIHLVGNRLGTILKRLRVEQAKGTRAKHLNKKTLSITPSPCERVEANGNAFREALFAACSKGLHSYSQAKIEQLSKIGLDSPHIEGQVSFRLSPDDDIGDIFLGIKKEVPFSSFKTFTKRFGIKLPEVDSYDGKITIEPNAVDTCSITIQDESHLPPAIFSGQLFLSPILACSAKNTGPDIPPDVAKSKIARISSNLLEITFSSNSLEITFHIDSSKQGTPECWRQVWRAMYALSSNSGRIKIVARNQPVNFEQNIPKNHNFPSTETCQYWISICENASFLLREAGIYPEPQLEFGDIGRSSTDISAAAAFLKKESISLSAECKTDSGIEMPTQEKCIVANALRLGSISIGYYCVADVESESLGENLFRLTAKGNSVSGARLLSARAGSYEEFISGVQQTEKARLVIRIDPQLSFS